MMRVGRMDDKVVLVTGGARGLGAAHAQLLADEGARVVIGDVRDEAGEALAEQIGPVCRYTHLDVTRPAEWKAAVSLAVATFGKLDVLVNNAGISGFGPVHKYKPEQWDRMIAVNLTGVFHGIQASVPALRASGGGSIVNVSSTAGLQGFENLGAYAASKFGVRGLTKVAALDLGRYKIRVNSVHPGTVLTPLVEELMGDLHPQQDHVALHRMGHPEEVAYLVLFLASDESSFSTGAEFTVDGGETAGQTHYGE